MAMRVVITGDRGFIGRAISERLSREGIQTIGYDILDGDDILNADALAGKSKGCDAIIHLAAVENQSETRIMETNILGTWNVLCASKASNIKKVIFLSSVDALGIFQGEGEPKYLPIDDAYPCHPHTAYSLSKKLSEEMCRHFSESQETTIICFRPPGVWDASTYEKIAAARRERPEYEWDPYWEYGAFIDIRDLSEAVYLALHKDLKGFFCLLLASDDITTSGRTSVELARKIHPNIKWKGGEEYERNPYKSLVLTDNAKHILGWNPKYSWKKSLEEMNAVPHSFEADIKT